MQYSFPEETELEPCIFCPQESDNQPSDLHEMMNQALFAKHLSQLSNNYMIPIDIMLKIEEPSSANELQEFITFKELAYVDQIEENMKREYKNDEFEAKTKMLSEYYKFHKDIPHVVEKGIEKILAKYYDRRREFDYKCIKKKLKDEQGVSITSVEDSVTENSETVEQKSRYSTLLIGLDRHEENSNILDKSQQNLMSDSNLLEEICKQIGQALPKLKVTDNDFKGLFYENNRNFDNYVKQQYVRNKKDTKSNKTNDFFKKRPKEMLQQENYLNFEKKLVKIDQNDTIKNRNNSLKFKTRRLSKEKGEKNDESHKKFIYNTNIKIEIKNAMFYPHDDNHLNFASGHTRDTRELNLSTGITKSRKSLIGKINTLTDDKFRTPISKIYQPQETEIASRYKKRSNSNKKEKTKSKVSKELNNLNQREEVESRESSFQRKAVSTHVSRRETLENINENTHGKLTHNIGTISVAKLKLEHQRNGLQMRNLSNIKKQSSYDNLRRKSVTFSQNKNSMERIPLFKYSSSEMKDKNLKGISIKDLLSKKLNVCEK